MFNSKELFEMTDAVRLRPTPDHPRFVTRFYETPANKCFVLIPDGVLWGGNQVEVPHQSVILAKEGKAVLKVRAISYGRILDVSLRDLEVEFLLFTPLSKALAKKALAEKTPASA